ncbi:hypothetical protein [uncultured Lutibacter sp.]|uniref:hypothetical protein n=1 Tax=uncultured Lutibacter sp. TaxID=437739 RepID=UPI00262146CB|nr:hypothetical protein [uncultured Lutibacter sp.]
MKKNLLFLLIILISISDLHSQKIYIGKTIEFNHSLIDRLNNIVYVYGDSIYKKIYLDSFKAQSFPLKTDIEFDLKSFTPLMVDSTPFFIHSKGGIVYKHRADSIVRIDNSFNHLMQTYSNIFSYNSTIHRFGGYGFWSARNFITYFDNTSTYEWDIVNPENSQELPEESMSGIHILIDDELYVFNSTYNNPLNRLEYSFNEKLWKYNFIEKKWTYLGDTEFINTIPTTHNIVFDDKLIIFQYSKYIVVDLINNTVKEFEKTMKGQQVYHVLEPFFHNNRFYFFDIDNSGQLYFSFASENEILGKEINSKHFYTNSLKVKTWVLTIFILILSYFIYKTTISIYRKRNKILLIENGLKYKRKFIHLDSEALIILKLLLTTNTVNSADILKVVEKGQFSRAHNERLKFQKIEEINFQLKTLLGSDEELITSKKSDFDRRIRVYSINKKYFI